MKPTIFHRTRSRNVVRAGFTLIELVITMAILTIIAGVAVPQFSNFSQKAQDSRRTADMVTVEKALESFNADFGRYPAGASGADWSGDAPGDGGYGYGANGYILGLVPSYLKELPRDPNGENKGGTERGGRKRGTGSLQADGAPFSDVVIGRRVVTRVAPPWAGRGAVGLLSFMVHLLTQMNYC